MTRSLSHMAHAVLTGAVLAIAPAVFADADDAVFTLGVGSPAPIGVDPSVVSAHAIDVDFARLDAIDVGTRFELPLPGARRLVIVADRVDVGASRTIHGRVIDQPHGEAMLSVDNGGVAGLVRTPGLGSWRIRPSGGQHVLLEVDAARLPACAGTPPDAELVAEAAHAQGELCEDGSRVDVLIYYTPVARADAGGHAAIQNEINLAVANTNQAYLNSAIGQQIRVVGLEQIDYDESGSYSDHLNRLTSDGDGFMDEAHTRREELAADLVALIVADGEFCGIAWLMPANSTSSEDRGFSVTTWYCAANFVLAHELGHNMGACHAPGDGGGCGGGGLFDYSVGYRYVGDSGTEWRTVMAYAPGSRISHFSNPEIVFDGEATGVPAEEPDSADNARTLDETSIAISNYRNPVCPGNAKVDCAVDFGDILKVLANWGAGEGLSDVNDDGIVDFMDILFVLGHWGPCDFG